MITLYLIFAMLLASIAVVNLSLICRYGFDPILAFMGALCLTLAIVDVIRAEGLIKDAIAEKVSETELGAK